VTPGNLLSTSIKFTPASGSVHVAVDLGSGCACLTVRDTGVGIPTELLPVIFDRYLQANRGGFGGLGLGLPIVKGLVELHGGVISVLSDGLGKGCTMTVRLPLLTAR
jgi:signal transduction histidine kinase